MKRLQNARNRWTRGTSFVDLMVSTAVTGILAAGMATGVVMVQRSSKASLHHVKSQVEQARLIDYVCRDLRRALTVVVDQYEGGKRITMTIPNYYDAEGKPADPVITQGTVRYGDAGSTLKVSYYKSGANIYRNVNGVASVLAEDVEDFAPDFTDKGEQVVGVSVSFVPKYQLNQRDVSGLRLGTATYATTLLRNKRDPQYLSSVNP